MEEKEEKISKKLEKIEEKGSFKERMSLKYRKKFIANKARTWLLVVTLVALFIAINLWAKNQVTAQIDVTENKIYTLSDASKEQIKSINKDVNIYIYGIDEKSPYYNLIKQYSAYNKKIKTETVTTENNYEIINKYNLDSNDYGTILVICGDRNTTLYPEYDFFTSDYVDGSYVEVDLAEESITNAVINVSADELTKVYLVTGHGEVQESGYSELINDLEDLVYECNTLNLITAKEIPNDCAVLVMINPASDISAEEAEVLKSYVNRGGKIFLSMFKNLNEDVSFANLQSVLDLYGAEVERGLLYEGSPKNYYANPYNLVLDFATTSNITSELSESGYYPLFPNSQRIKTKDINWENVSLNIEDLLFTSSSCYNITDIDKLRQGFDLNGMPQDKYSVALKFNRELTSKVSEDSEETTVTKSSLILVGNVDAITSYYNYTANKNFVLNCFASLSEKEDLMTIRKYTSSSSTFDVTATTMSLIIVRTIIFALPILIIIVGIIVWLNRRRKR